MVGIMTSPIPVYWFASMTYNSEAVYTKLLHRQNQYPSSDQPVYLLPTIINPLFLLSVAKIPLTVLDGARVSASASRTNITVSNALEI